MKVERTSHHYIRLKHVLLLPLTQDSLYNSQNPYHLQWHQKRDQLPHHNQPPSFIYPPHYLHHSFINLSPSWWWSLAMMEYLQLSCTKYLNFQGNDKQNNKLGTPVVFLNSPLSPTANLPPLLWRSFLNTNKRQFTGFIECLCHQKLQIISCHGSEHLNWEAWCLVWYLLTSSGRSEDLCNHNYLYFIVLLGKGSINSWIGWGHVEGFKGSERCVIVKSPFYAFDASVKCPFLAWSCF